MKLYLRTGLILIACTLLAGEKTFSQDKYAEIGTRQYENRTHLLIEPKPPLLPETDLPVNSGKKYAFRPVLPISTKEELDQELAELRKYFEPFLSNQTPRPKKARKRVPLNDFEWRVETKRDLTDFTSVLKGEGEWSKVEIPHYAPPLGRATTYYFKNIELAEEDFADELLFICFDGVDYKASVFVNGAYCGSHEGFFAPFEFNITDKVKPGSNLLLIKVENDFPTTGMKDQKGHKIYGDKIYGATGPGYDDPELGWHHCPPAMGIYQDCYLELREDIHINDIFVRPEPEKSSAEIWIEVNNFRSFPESVKLNLNIYGQNFTDTLISGLEVIPSTTYIPGVGDLTKPQDWQKEMLKMQYGVNYLKIPVSLDGFRWWNPDTPWLYQVQIDLYDSDNVLKDSQYQQFGMRSFSMDTLSVPRGNMYLNGQKIRLRGANTMGHLQTCVMKGDYDQLIDDILLAKLANMNFLRFTQRPVQKEIYEYCDKLGLLNQTDLPLFGSLRRNKFTEAVKQGEEMERLIRPHPSAIIVTYINERFPNAEGYPHRSLNTAEEYHKLFSALDNAILLSNPDRVIKPGDGDYDPPSPGIPDNHCYNLWYNGHGLGVGKMYKGYWQLVKPDWNYACGEFGTEGLDPLNTMKKYYPESWLPDNESGSSWNPSKISMSQSQKFHYMWYNTPGSIRKWIEASQNYQAWATKFTTEAFRRDSRMVSFAIHLFIDAWPGGWMKAIMDVDRQPKKAYFAYRNALEPLMVSVRSDRNNFFSGEKTALELWIANDQNNSPDNTWIYYQLEKNGKILYSNRVVADIPVNSSRFQGFIRYPLPDVRERTSFLLRTAVMKDNGESIAQNTFEMEVFPSSPPPETKIFFFGETDIDIKELFNSVKIKQADQAEDAEVIIIDEIIFYKKNEEYINKLVEEGKTAWIVAPEAGTYSIADTKITVRKTEMGDYYFVSPETNNPVVQDFKPNDFRFWYDESKDYITPLISHIFTADAWTPLLTSGSSNWISDEGMALAAAELNLGKGKFIINEVQLNNRIDTNPVAKQFLYNLLSGN